MEAFMDYFGGMGFLNLLYLYFPIGVAVFSVILTMVFRNVSISVTAVIILFGTFFAYSYSQFNATVENFLIPLIVYIIIAYLISKVTKRIIVKA